MRAVIQRVSEASVTIGGRVKSSIDGGLLVLVGVVEEDTVEDIQWLCRKITQLRIFNDEDGVMNRSLIDISGNILLVSQFTLHASTKKGNRPSYIAAAQPATAIPLYELLIQKFNAILPNHISTGEFGADMKVSLVNDGPVTIIIDTKDKR